MTKFDIEVKKNLIALMESNKHSIYTAAKEVGVSKSVAHRWWKLYRLHGYEGLSMGSGKYSGEFKVYVVKYMHENRLSLEETSATFGIPSSSTLLNWERIYFEEGESGLFTDRRGRPSKEDMKKNETKIENNSNNNETKEDLILEVKRLRAEVAYLKKSIALKEKKRNLQTKKKQW